MLIPVTGTWNFFGGVIMKKRYELESLGGGERVGDVFDELSKSITEGSATLEEMTLYKILDWMKRDKLNPLMVARFIMEYKKKSMHAAERTKAVLKIEGLEEEKVEGESDDLLDEVGS